MSHINWVGHGCTDLTMTTFGDPPRPGGLCLIGESGVSLGGSAFNKAIAACKLTDVLAHRCVAPIGNDVFGIITEHLLANEAPGLELGLIRVAESQTSHTYIEVSQGDRSFRHHPGVNDICTADDIIESMSQYACATVFGYPALMHQMLINDGEGTKRLFEATSGLRVLDMVSVDPESFAGKIDWASWHKNVMPHTDLYCPSAEELLFMLDRERFNELSNYSTERKVIDHFDVQLLDHLAQRVINMGCPMVLIKLGPRGLYLATSDQIVDRLPPRTNEYWTGREIWAPAYRESRFVSSTGAGDVAIAAFVVRAMLGYMPCNVLASSAAAGTYCVEAVGATDNIPSIKKLNERMVGWSQLDAGINEGCGRWHNLPSGKLWFGYRDRNG